MSTRNPADVSLSEAQRILALYDAGAITLDRARYLAAVKAGMTWSEVLEMDGTPPPPSDAETREIIEAFAQRLEATEEAIRREYNDFVRTLDARTA